LKKAKKRGLGSKLVEACLSEVVELGLRKVFVLTLIKDFLPALVSKR